MIDYKRCVYCGAPVLAASLACDAHRPLIYHDPAYAPATVTATTSPPPDFTSDGSDSR